MIILVGVVFAMIIRKLGLPNLLGYLLAGIILGPFVFNAVSYTHLDVYKRQIVKVVIQANLNYDFAKNEMPKPSEMPAIAQVLMNIFKRAIDEKVIRTDLKPLELMKLSAIVLTGCLQIWATAPHDIDLEKFYMKNVGHMLNMK